MSPYSWLKSWSVVTTSTALVSGATVGFYVIENCSVAECPFGHDGSDLGTNDDLRSRLEPGAQVRALKRLLQGPWSAIGWSEMYRCTLQSEVACICLILCAWASSVAALKLLLFLVVPRPHKEELTAFRSTAAVFLLQAVFMLSYVVAVSQEGYADVTSVLLLWSVKFSSRQLSSIMPLRSTTIKRAHNINIARLVSMLLAYSACTVAHAGATFLFWRHAAEVSPIVMFELWSAPLGILTFGHLALLEGLHIAEEMSMRSVMQGHAPYMLPDRRAEIADYVKLVHGVGRGVTVFFHRLQMLRSFGIQWRLGDFVLLADARISSQRVLKSVELHLQNSLSNIQIDHHYPTATTDEVEEVQTCAICHVGLRQGGRRRLVMPKRLPCGHVFHLGCVCRWMLHSLGKEATCPMCRLQLPNALEASNADCWQARAAGGIRWWLDWPRQHAISVLRLATFFGNRMFPPPPGGLAEYMEGSQSDAAAAGATMADVAQPPELRSRLRAVTMNSGADPDLARRMLEGYLSVRESLERREGLYTVIGHAESADGTPVTPVGTRSGARGPSGATPQRAAPAPPSPQSAGNLGSARGQAERAAGARRRGGAASTSRHGDSGAGRLQGVASAPDEGEGRGVRHGRFRRTRHFEPENDGAEATMGSELVAVALSSPLWGMLARESSGGQNSGTTLAEDGNEGDAA